MKKERIEQVATFLRHQALPLLGKGHTARARHDELIELARELEALAIARMPPTPTKTKAPHPDNRTSDQVTSDFAKRSAQILERARKERERQ
jgi:hypothetical protein